MLRKLPAYKPNCCYTAYRYRHLVNKEAITASASPCYNQSNDRITERYRVVFPTIWMSQGRWTKFSYLVSFSEMQSLVSVTWAVAILIGYDIFSPFRPSRLRLRKK